MRELSRGEWGERAARRRGGGSRGEWGGRVCLTPALPSAGEESPQIERQGSVVVRAEAAQEDSRGESQDVQPPTLRKEPQYQVSFLAEAKPVGSEKTEDTDDSYEDERSAAAITRELGEVEKEVGQKRGTMINLKKFCGGFRSELVQKIEDLPEDTHEEKKFKSAAIKYFNENIDDYQRIVSSQAPEASFFRLAFKKYLKCVSMALDELPDDVAALEEQITELERELKVAKKREAEAEAQRKAGAQGDRRLKRQKKAEDDVVEAGLDESIFDAPARRGRPPKRGRKSSGRRSF